MLKAVVRNKQVHCYCVIIHVFIKTP